MTLVYLALAWLTGIAAAHHTPVHWIGWVVPGGIALLGLTIFHKTRPARLAFACGIALSAGAARFCLSIPSFTESDLAFYNGTDQVEITGWVTHPPVQREDRVDLVIRAENIRLPDGLRLPVEGLLLAQVPGIAGYQYGDRVTVSGDIETPPEYDTFSYKDYLARSRVYSIMAYARAHLSGDIAGSRLWRGLLAFREKGHQTVIALLPDPYASLLSGILLGIESDISPEVRESFNAVSATHIIAISGSNLVILAGVIQAVALRLLKRPHWAIVATISGIIAYALFVGADPAVIRAAGMTSLALTATALGRQTYGLVSLGFAAWLMTLINPLLLWDVGFQLSFLATLGLILYVEPIQNVLKNGLSLFLSREKARELLLLLSEAFVVTIAAQITTTPLMAYTFERFSLVALPVNLLIVPAQSPLMVFGGIAVTLAMVIYPLGQIFAWLSWLFLFWTVSVVEFFAQFPMASLEVAAMPAWQVWAIYAGLLILTLALKRRSDQNKKTSGWLREAVSIKTISALGLLLIALFTAAAWSLPDGRLHIRFLDVGDGGSTLITTPTGRQILVDAGGSGRRASAELGRSLPFWDRRIDSVILTGTTQRQIGALPILLRRYRFDSVILGDNPTDSQTWSTVSAQFEENATSRLAAQPGIRIETEDGLFVEILACPGTDPARLDIMVSYRDARILLASNQSVCQPPQATVLQVTALDQHCRTLLEAVNPQIVVLTADSSSPYLERASDESGVMVFELAQAGSIHLITDGTRIRVITRRYDRSLTDR